MSAGRTRAGLRLQRMFQTYEGTRGNRSPRAFDARLAERIVEEFVPMVEEEAAATPGQTVRMGDVLFFEWAGSVSWGRVKAIGGSATEITVGLERIAGTSDGDES